ncbi:PE domain-containing protein [Pseudonocardia sp. NPDC049635]|uniref:PE domain-containing protein n=1 Tax=Pseudonocardia sp. NPDC049635 TaxID=3155506 RepID=UPI0033F37D60
MPAPRPDLRIDPSTPPTVVAALDRAADRLATVLDRLDADARRVRPWLGDPVSAQAAARYAGHAADGADAAIERIRALRTELVRARDAVARSGRAYTATEAAVAGTLR